MINLYSGTPGSGKSLHAACTLYHWLRRRQPCIANFDINFSGKLSGLEKYYIYIPNDKLSPDVLYHCSDTYFAKHNYKEDKILLVIDECQLIFNARTWSAHGRDRWLEFFTQHRKFGYYIILIAQFDRMIDRQIRDNIEYNYIHRKVSNFGVFGKIFSIFSFGKLFVAVKLWAPLKERTSSDFFVARKKYYSLYDTRKRFNNSVPGAGAAAPDSA